MIYFRNAQFISGFIVILLSLLLLTRGNEYEASETVKGSGEYDGTEVARLYVRGRGAC